jgi:Uma2 family endonuclease
MVASPRRPSFDELYARIRDLPEGQRGEILLAGELHVTMGRPGNAHRRAAQVVHHALAPKDATYRGSGWWIEIEPEVRFGERLFDPDLAGWRVERVPQLPEENPIDIVPDWACEVLSPSTHRVDVQIKLPGYIAAGVGHVWIVDPEAKLVQVFAPRDGKPLLLATASEEPEVALPPFELPIDVRLLWGSVG